MLELQFIPLNYYIFTTVSNFLTCISLSLFVLLKNFRSNLNRTFSAFCFAIAQWSFFYFLFLSIKDTRLADFYIRTCMIGVIFMPSTFTHFVTILVGAKKNKPLIFLNYLISISIAATVYSSLYAKTGGSFLVFPYWPLAGVLFPVHLGHFFINLLYSYPLIFRTLKESNGILKGQIRYVLLGTGIGFLGGLTNYFTWYRIGVPPVLNISASLGVPIISYAIIKYRFMDIDLARRYVAIYFSFGIVTLALFTPLIFLFRHSIPGLMITGFVMILSAPYLHRWIEKALRPAFLSKYAYWDKLAKFWEKERIVFTSGQLADTLKEISEVMGLESFSFFLFEPTRKVFVPRAYQGLDGVFDPEQAEVLNTIYPDDPLVMYLEKEKRIIIRDELVTQSGENHQAVLLKMDELKAQISAPLFIAGRLTGILNLGPKKKKEMFHEKDLGLINEVAQTAQRHLSHIAFFENSLFFSGSVAHDIRKPFRQGIIYGCLDDLQKGPLNPAQKEALDNLKERLVSLDDMSEDMVGAFKNLELFLKSGFKPQKIDYTRLINEESKSFKPMAEERKLTFEIDLPKTEFFLYADPLSVQRILNELLTNAIKYTERGKITVKVSCENPQEILTEVSDTGCGIVKEDQEEIWELFKRGKNGQTKEGAGIGLAMVRQLVEANAGKIWLDSERGKGSSFFFTLPAWEDKKVR